MEKKSGQKEKTMILKMKNKSGTDHPQSEERGSGKTFLPGRMNFLLFIIFVLFSALIVQLAYLQILNGDRLEAEIKKSTQEIVEGNAPRGMIYDAAGKVLAKNKANQAIIYTRGNNVSGESLYKLANRLNKLIDVKADKLTERDKKDYWLANKKNFETADKRLSAAERQDSSGTELEEATLYGLRVDKVTADEIKFDASTMKAATIFKRMNSAVSLSQVFIKNSGVTDKEIAVVGEHIAELSGVSTGMDWTREYPSSTMLQSVLGTVSTDKTGLPQEEKDYYLAKGYSLNDRVGTSYLEKQYESVLKGSKSQALLTLGTNQEIEAQKNLFDGEKGKNLVLTIDEKFQKKMEDVVKKRYQILAGSSAGKYSPGVYAVAMNPKTGEILGMVGYDHNTKTGKITENPLGVVNNAYVPGSAIKAATITAGYESGVLKNYDEFKDEPLKFRGTASKSSIFNRYGSSNQMLNEVSALTQSSNVYMMKIVLKMLGTEYKYNMQLPYNTSVYQTLRGTYEQFGLGTNTGVDLPAESTGFINNTFDENSAMGNLLDLSYGNYDTYTPLQLAQYISTVANNGTRIAPRLVKGIYGNSQNGGLGTLEQEIKPKVLNRLDITAEQLNIIKKGLYGVVHTNGGTGSYMRNVKFSVAGKTGTAEVAIPGSTSQKYIENLSFVGYGPTSDPQIAVSVILPFVDDAKAVNQEIATSIFNAYYDMYMK